MENKQKAARLIAAFIFTVSLPFLSAQTKDGFQNTEPRPLENAIKNANRNSKKAFKGPEGNASGKAQTPAEKSAETKNYFLREENDETVLYQHLSWEPLNDILAFEFILDKYTKNGKWERLEKKTVQENYTDVSLSPGSYRYKIAVVNLLEQRETESDYRYFDVIRAYQPIVSSISPRTIYFEDIEDDTINVSGKNLNNQTAFSLTTQSGSAIRGTVVERNKSGSRVKIQFPMNKINPGDYVFTAVDISGLSDETKMLTFKFRKPVDFYLSGGYAVNGFIGNKVFKEYFNTDFSAASGILKMTLIPIKRTYGRFGFNITGSGMFMQNKQEFYRLKAGILFFNFNFVYLYPIIKRRLHFEVHAGTGPEFLVQTQFLFQDSQSPSRWFWGMAVNTGTAFQIFVYKKLYIEINVEHIFPLQKGFPTYIIQPSLSIGWEF